MKHPSIVPLKADTFLALILYVCGNYLIHSNSQILDNHQYNKMYESVMVEHFKLVK